MRYLTYEEMTEILDWVIQKIKDSGKQYDEVIAVCRGGFTAGHYVAKELRLPMGVYFPSCDNKVSRIATRYSGSTKFLFVEDLVAQGRTYADIRNFMSNWQECTVDRIGWDFLPVLVDGNYPGNFELQGLKTKEWIVMPYEKVEKMKEGDRGLFREGTDVYDK